MGFFSGGIHNKKLENDFSLVKCFLMILTIIFTIELIVMHALPFIIPGEYTFATNLLDSALLTAILSPFLWLLIVRPLKARAITEGEWGISLFGMVKDGVVTLDQHGMIVTLNRAAEEMFQCTAAEIEGQPFGKLVSLENSGEDREPSTFNPSVNYADLVATCQEATGRRAGRRPFPLEISISRSKPGRDHFVVAILRDISERKLMEEEIKRARDDWEEVFSSIRDAVLLVDGSHKVVRTNQAAAEMFGVSQNKLLAQKCFMSVHGTDCPPQLCPSCDVMQTLKPSTTECYEPHLMKYLEIKAIPRINKSGKPAGLIHIISDISERKKADNERLGLIAQLEKRNEELEQFTYTVSHDLRTPLVTISGFVGQLKLDLEHGNDDCVSVDLDFIESSAVKMGSLLDSLLHLAQSGRPIREPVPVKLANIIQQALEFNGGVLEKFTIKTDNVGNLPTIYGDPVRLFEVFQQIIENAAKFTSEVSKPLIEIGSKVVNNEVLIFVRDNGIGIPKEYQQQVFSLFEKLDPSTKGTGIGLAIVRRVIVEHGGQVWIESTEEGTTFWLTLPLTADQ